MSEQWIVEYAGVPPASIFGSTRGQGTPLIIDTTTGTLYYYKSGVGVTALGGGGGVTVLDEGVPLATTATGLDFVGAGVVASGAGATKTITIAGGGAGSVAQVAATLTGVPYGIQYAEKTVVDANILVGSKVIVGWGNITDADENTPDMDDVEFNAVPAAGSMIVRISAREQTHRIGGTYKINYLIG